ncbi:adenosylcobinamide-phosphate synthase [Chitinophaga polysaccharea]|uniref:Cobalamin biosynthesis protein CobD n=1 Tax=Chitinophaga polysaccharea TaxID=1293035 RepID=A0A561P9S6_9BACT|nr:adenosylcobinamide-phosphate synthase CbiB [Chitinophaga polysaccharea]TWF34893.1 adenosylcobinamide-phosphate synthase [Chitinophaga polysaccharea]
MDLILKFVLPLLLGYLLDLVLGDPQSWPHPVKGYGKLIHYGTQRLNKGGARFWKGALLTVASCTAVYLFFYGMQKALMPWPLAYYSFSTIFIFFALANKSLLKEGREVFDALQYNGLEAGRQRLSRIVGRDTTELTPDQVRIAVMESMSENLSDGVVAPLCFYAVLGLPGMMMYKMINTLDSMIGYKNEKYLHFGRFAARLDDVANYIPARLTAGLMIILYGSSRAWYFVVKYGAAHTSPNAGYPEAALAGILDCRFGGPNTYQGKLVDKPYIGENDRSIAHEEFRTVALLNHAVTFTVVICIAAIKYYLLWQVQQAG